MVSPRGLCLVDTGQYHQAVVIVCEPPEPLSACLAPERARADDSIVHCIVNLQSWQYCSDDFSRFCRALSSVGSSIVARFRLYRTGSSLASYVLDTVGPAAAGRCVPHDGCARRNYFLIVVPPAAAGRCRSFLHSVCACWCEERGRVVSTTRQRHSARGDTSESCPLPGASFGRPGWVIAGHPIEGTPG